MKALAFALGCCIAVLGAAGVVAPGVLVWFAGQFVTSGSFYVAGAVRVGFGLVFIASAAASRAPRALRVLGYLAVISGVTAALMGLLGPERARAMIEGWMQQGSGLVRLTAVLILAVGGFVAYACAPLRSAVPVSHDGFAPRQRPDA